MKKIAIIGLGLIGGSLAKAWRKHMPQVQLIGYDREHVVAEALKRDIIHEAPGSAEAAAAAADLIVLATPIGTILTLLERIAPYVKPGALVTDVGSVKQPVKEHAAKHLPEGIAFVGGHPMAGSEKTGLQHADPYLFENATYVLCPPDEADRIAERCPFLIEAIEAIGARILIMEASRHDRIAAAISHLPQLLAVTLMNYVGDMQQQDDGFLRLAAGGFRDMTRIASSPYAMWRDILVANEGPILDMLGGFAAALQRTRNRVIEEDEEALSELFGEARQTRKSIPKNTKGFLHPLADVYVYAEDKPGFLFQLTRVLHEADADIKDIELLKIREGIEGAFRIGFSDDKESKKAIETLTEAGYTAFSL